ncbi:MAG: hypothetical protein LBC70_07270 [Chitinispirillales bacterium]|nr:hypothetical protein [Chitinispirillales bacterium]
MEAKAGMYRQGMSFKDACEKLFGLLGGRREIMLKNDNDGGEARLSKSSIGKLMSNVAARKSVDNGFAKGQHYAVASDIDNLYRDSVKIRSHSDKHKNPDVTIHRFAVPLHFDDGVAYITIKESTQHGRRVHSVELMKIKRLESVLEEAKTSSNHVPSSSLKESRRYDIRRGGRELPYTLPSPGFPKDTLGGISEETGENSLTRFSTLSFIILIYDIYLTLSIPKFIFLLINNLRLFVVTAQADDFEIFKCVKYIV